MPALILSRAIAVVPMAGVDLAGKWNAFWGKVQGPAKGVFTLLAIIGMLLIVGAAITWLWQKRKGGGGGNSQPLIVAIILGAIFAGPDFIIPTILKVVDFAVELVKNFMELGT